MIKMIQLMPTLIARAAPNIKKYKRMKRRNMLALLLGYAVTSFTPTAAAQEITISTSAKKFYVIDGDSISYGYFQFRLCGIQAPERGAFFYEKATDMLRALSGDGLIAARLVDVDKYKRQIVVLRVVSSSPASAQTINEQMVAQGGAEHYKRYSHNCVPYIKRRTFTDAEKTARQRGLGIWRRN